MIRPHYSLVTAPTREPVTLDQAMVHLRVDSEEDIEYVGALISVAREYIESVTGRVSSPTVFMVVADSWASLLGSISQAAFPLYRTPLSSVASISYYPHGSTSLVVMPSSDYLVITTTEPGMIKIIDSPPAVSDRPDAIQIVFSAGYLTPENAPPILQHAIKMLVAHLYEQRVPAVIGNIVNVIPFGLASMIENQKIGGWVA